MSGAEVLGVISSIISIVDGAKQVYDAARSAQGLPDAFREVAGRLPIVVDILGLAEQHIKNGDVDEDSCKGVKHVVMACREKAKKLDDLFHSAIPADGASDLKRYYKAVKAYGKGNEVENLMKGILEDVQLLACEHGMKTATEAQQEQISKAITEVSAIVLSVPEHVFQDTGFTANNSGPGTQNNAQGEYIAQGNSRQYNSSGGTMNFGKD
jgi:N-terminal domain on NACHT_NTPase and P-loop NTPases